MAHVQKNKFMAQLQLLPAEEKNEKKSMQNKVNFIEMELQDIKNNKVVMTL